ncbi:hypothetical protein [Desulfogranum japonicum]|uniref:hypothetical protein n=1 Tax=Desulfogranum japonicum TaxID=231447 RepID=UPI0004221D19|nr:hypothetical protein [Desulfogranum japonicum]
MKMQKKDWLQFIVFSLGVIGSVVVLFREFLFDQDTLLGSVMSDQLNGLGSRFIRDTIVLPQWDGSHLGGLPTLDAMFGDAYHPLVFLQLIMDPARAVGIKFIVCIILAYFAGAILFSYISGKWKTGAFLGVLYAFSPVFFSLIYAGHDGKMMVFSVMPLVLYGLMKLIKEGKIWGSCIVTIGLTWMLLSSHLQLVYFVLWGLLMYSLYLTCVQQRHRLLLKVRIFRQVILGVAVAAALLLAAVQILPPYIYTTSQSVRSSEQKTTFGHAVSWSLHQEEVAAMLMPQFLGTINTTPGSTHPVSEYWGHNSLKINSDSPGMLLILLAFLSLSRRFDRGEKLFWLAGATCVLIYAVGAHTPLFQVFFTAVPGVKNFRAPAMIALWMPCIAGILAALLFKEEKKSTCCLSSTEIFPVLMSFVGVLLLLTFSRYWWPLSSHLASCVVLVFALVSNVFLVRQYASPVLRGASGLSGMGRIIHFPWHHLIVVNLFFMFLLFVIYSGSDVVTNRETGSYFRPLQKEVMQQTVAAVWYSFVVGCCCVGAVWFFFQHKYSPLLRYVALLAVGLLDTLSVNVRYIEVVPRRDFIAEKQPFIQILQAEHAKDPLNDYRTLSAGPLPRIFNNNTMAVYGLRSAAGFHDNELQSYRQFRRGGGRDSFLGPVMERQDITASAFLNIMNVKYLFLPHPEHQVQLLKNRAAFARTTLYYQYDIVPDVQLLEQLYTGRYPYRQVIPFSEQPAFDREIPRHTVSFPETSGGSSRITSLLSQDSYHIETNAVRPGVLLFSENYHPYWKAKVNGEDKPVWRAFTTLIAVEVPEGKSSVELSYRSEAVAWAKGCIFFGGILFFSLCVLQLKEKNAGKKTIS